MTHRVPFSVLALAALLLAAWAMACSGSAPSVRGEAAEPGASPVGEPKPPQVVADKGAEIARRLGRSVICAEWSWAPEDSVWECAIVGLSRSAELDLDSDGRFLELDLVLGHAEIEQAVPVVASTIADRCQDPARTVAEASIRTEALVGSDPQLERLWGQHQVFIEVRCPDGTDFEVDPFGTVVTVPDHDAAEGLE